MIALTSQDKTLKNYEENAREIMRQMFNVLTRAQRKKDDLAYRQIIEKLEKNK